MNCIQQGSLGLFLSPLIFVPFSSFLFSPYAISTGSVVRSTMTSDQQLCNTKEDLSLRSDNYRHRCPSPWTVSTGFIHPSFITIQDRCPISSLLSVGRCLLNWPFPFILHVLLSTHVYLPRKTMILHESGRKR